MRDKNQFQSKDLQDSIKFFVKKRIPRRIEVLRNQIVNNPNFLESFDSSMKIPCKRSENILSLALISWILPEEVGVLLRLELQNFEKIMNQKDKILLRIFLNDFNESIEFLERTRRWHSRDFFGNFLKKGLEDLCSLSFRRISRRVKRPKRKRGYHDHGSRRPDSKWLPSFDFTFTEQQNLKEETELYLDKLTNRVQRILRNSLERKVL